MVLRFTLPQTHAPRTLPLPHTARPHSTLTHPTLPEMRSSEITYLTKHHPNLFTPALSSKLSSLLLSSSLSLSLSTTHLNIKKLEQIDIILNKLNIKIIEKTVQEKIRKNLNNPNKTLMHPTHHSTPTHLYLKKITRIPAELFTNKKHQPYWQNLTLLDCSDNLLTSLKLPNFLTALTYLDASYNDITSLELPNLTNMKYLSISHNNITHLNLQNTSALRGLKCQNNPLRDINLHGTSEKIKKTHGALEEALLFKQLQHTTHPETISTIIQKLGARYTYFRCATHLGINYAATRFASTVYTYTSAYLPSFTNYFKNNQPPPANKKRGIYYTKNSKP